MDIVTQELINILIQLAEADKHFAEPERELILKIAREKNFPEETVHQLIRNPKPIDSLGALSPSQKYEYLYSAIELIFADRTVFESELVFSKNIAIKLGFKKNVVDFIVENFQTQTREQLKPQVMRQYT